MHLGFMDSTNASKKGTGQGIIVVTLKMDKGNHTECTLKHDTRSKHS